MENIKQQIKDVYRMANFGVRHAESKSELDFMKMLRKKLVHIWQLVKEKENE